MMTKKYDVVLTKFDAHFKVRKNVIFERARYNQRKQEPGESAELYTTTIHQMADKCDYGAELIRDRLVVGIHDKALSECMQMKANLTFEKAKTFIRQREAVKKQGLILASGNKPHLDSMQPRRPRKKSFHPPAQMRKRQNGTCRRCGQESHPVQQCPARNEICHKTPASESTEEESDDVYLGAAYLNTVGGDTNSWKIELEVDNKPLPFKIDTGAEVTAISESAWKSLQNLPALTKTTKHLCGPDRYRGS